MTEQERIKYTYECMVKNNPDEAVKTLIRFENNLRNLGMGGLHRKPDKFYDLSELPDEVNILVSPKGYGKTYHELKILNNRINKAIEYIKKFEDIKAYYSYEENGYEEYNYDEDFKKELLDILRGKDNDK